MRTWTAALTHIGIAAAQVGTAIPYFNNNTPIGFLGNAYTQIGAQVGLSLLQAWAAKKNSETDPKGNPLVQNLDNKFITR